MSDETNKDLKEGQESPDGGGQPTEGSENGGGNDTITVKKADYEKLQSNHDNYRDAVIKHNTDSKKLDPASETNEGKKEDPVDITIDETKVGQIVDNKTSSFFADIEKSNEARAKRNFLSKYPEYIDDGQWVDMVSDFSPRRGKKTIEDIQDDLEDAVLLHKRRTGKLDEHLKSEHERGRQQGRTEAQAEGGHVGGVGDKKDEGSSSSGFETPKGEEMARGMKIDPEKAKKIDPLKDSVINVV